MPKKSSEMQVFLYIGKGSFRLDAPIYPEFNSLRRSNPFHIFGTFLLKGF